MVSPSLIQFRLDFAHGTRSLRMSIIALTSLVSIAIATVQYSTTGHPVAQPQTATPDTRSYSILDYLSAPPISSSILSETGSSSFIPDVRLIKNALSLSTKSVALAPAEVRSTVKAHKPQAQVPISRSAGPTADSLSLSLRNTDVGLTTLSDVSAKWHKSLKDLVKGSVPKATEKASPPVNLTRQGECGYGQVLLSDLKSAWTRAISGFSYTDFIHFVRNQIFATIKAEINEAIYLAHEVSALSRNFTRLTASYLLKGSVSVRALVDDEIRHIFVDKLGFDYHSLSAFNATRVRSAATKQAAQNARSGLNALSSQAAMGARFGKEAIYKARAGLDHLITEAQRLRKGEGDEKEMPLPLKWECRAAHGRGQNKGHPGRWSRRRGNGRTATSPRLARRRSPTETSWRQRFFQAVHNVSLGAAAQSDFGLMRSRRRRLSSGKPTVSCCISIICRFQRSTSAGGGFCVYTISSHRCRFPSNCTVHIVHWYYDHATPIRRNGAWRCYASGRRPTDPLGR